MENNPADWLARANEVHEHAANLWWAYAASFGGLAVAVVAFSGLAALIFGVVFFRAPVSGEEADVTRNYRRLVERILLVALLICVALALAFQAHFKDRWMQPVLFITPVALTLWFHRRLNATRGKILLALNGFIAVRRSRRHRRHAGLGGGHRPSPLLEPRLCRTRRADPAARIFTRRHRGGEPQDRRQFEIVFA